MRTNGSPVSSLDGQWVCSGAEHSQAVRLELRANAHGFSLHAAVRWRADQRKELEQLCRYITRPAIANERLKRYRAGQV